MKPDLNLKKKQTTVSLEILVIMSLSRPSYLVAVAGYQWVLIIYILYIIHAFVDESIAYVLSVFVLLYCPINLYSLVQRRN